MKTGLLGWGSLIWDKEREHQLPLNIDWHTLMGHP